jgi:hypothetical protein
MAPDTVADRAAEALAKPIQDMTLEDQYAILIDSRRDAQRLAAGGSVTAARECVSIDRDLAKVEAALREKHCGPRPVDTVTEPLDTATLMAAVHPDCIILVESDDRQSRVEALARLLPYVQRGKDLAFLLGFETG